MPQSCTRIVYVPVVANTSPDEDPVTNRPLGVYSSARGDSVPEVATTPKAIASPTFALNLYVPCCLTELMVPLNVCPHEIGVCADETTALDKTHSATEIA